MEAREQPEELEGGSAGQDSAARPSGFHLVEDDPACSMQLFALQQSVFQRLKVSEDGLKTFNEASIKEYSKIATEMTRNTELLRSIKNDMISIFTRVGQLKRRLRDKYPQEYEQALNAHQCSAGTSGEHQ